VPERACKAGTVYGIEGIVAIVERPQHGESTGLVSRWSPFLKVSEMASARVHPVPVVW
jgi:hypothetical protein